MKKPFEFELYRMNTVHHEDLFNRGWDPISSNAEHLTVLQELSKPKYDWKDHARKHDYLWSIRDFASIQNNQWSTDPLVLVTLARSTIRQQSRIVTDSGMTNGTTDLSPPPADEILFVFYLERHLVAVERNYAVTYTRGWRKAFHTMIDAAASALKKRSHVRLEPVSRKLEIVENLRSFQVLSRLRVNLRLPNPEISRLSKQVREDMEKDGIREYLQDMKNPNGLNTDEDGRPFASAALAESGYKEGEVLMEGVKEGKKTVIRTGEKAARGQIDALRDYVRGMKDLVKTQEGKRVVQSIVNEIDRIHERPEE